jgi:YfiH family protein
VTIDMRRCDALVVRHGFFTRNGGISSGPYATLNCSLGGQDRQQDVLENRGRAARAIGADPADLVGAVQVHGSDVAHVTAAMPRSAWARADGLVTDRIGVVLGIVTADCAPVLLSDPVARVVGAAHAGWRGAVAGVIEATVAAMLRLGARSDRIAAAIGPCIGASSYEVGADLRDAVLRIREEDARYLNAGVRAERWLFDLRGYCRRRLQDAGVATIQDVAADTLADEAHFFSHRRRTLTGGGPIGHQISLIAAG